MGFLEKVSSFIESLTIHAQSGFQVVEEKEMLRRLQICNDCPHVLTKNGEIHKCGACGCYLNAKVQWQTSTCPTHRWFLP